MTDVTEDQPCEYHVTVEKKKEKKKAIHYGVCVCSVAGRQSVTAVCSWNVLLCILLLASCYIRPKDEFI